MLVYANKLNYHTGIIHRKLLTLERRWPSINAVPLYGIDKYLVRSKRPKSPGTLGQMRRALALSALLVLAALVGSACAGKPFNVKPKPTAPPGNFRSRISTGALELRAGTIRDDDCLYEMFDANLVLAGVLPVKFSIKNSGAGHVDLKPVRFWLEAAGQRRKPIQPRSAFGRLMKYYKIRAYNPNGYKASKADFASYGFDSGAPLASGESRWGVLFFEPPSGQPPAGLVLAVKGIAATELKLSVD
jgi:hypothetical protein